MRLDRLRVGVFDLVPGPSITLVVADDDRLLDDVVAGVARAVAGRGDRGEGTVTVHGMELDLQRDLRAIDLSDQRDGDIDVVVRADDLPRGPLHDLGSDERRRRAERDRLAEEASDRDRALRDAMADFERVRRAQSEPTSREAEARAAVAHATSAVRAAREQLATADHDGREEERAALHHERAALHDDHRRAGSALRAASSRLDAATATLRAADRVSAVVARSEDGDPTGLVDRLAGAEIGLRLASEVAARGDRSARRASAREELAEHFDALGMDGSRIRRWIDDLDDEVRARALVASRDAAADLVAHRDDLAREIAQLRRATAARARDDGTSDGGIHGGGIHGGTVHDSTARDGSAANAEDVAHLGRLVEVATAEVADADATLADIDRRLSDLDRRVADGRRAEERAHDARLGLVAAERALVDARERLAAVRAEAAIPPAADAVSIGLGAVSTGEDAVSTGLDDVSTDLTAAQVSARSQATTAAFDRARDRVDRCRAEKVRADRALAAARQEHERAAARAEELLAWPVDADAARAHLDARLATVGRGGTLGPLPIVVDRALDRFVPVVAGSILAGAPTGHQVVVTTGSVALAEFARASGWTVVDLDAEEARAWQALG